MAKVVQRTCIGCKAIDQPDRLVRLTVQTEAAGAVVVVDYRRTLGGRGAWLHPTHECVGKAQQRRAFDRAFKASVNAESAVREVLVQCTRDSAQVGIVHK